MKTRKKFYVAEFVTDLYFCDDETQMFYAESKQAVEQELNELLGIHLLAYYIRKATRAEKKNYLRLHQGTCIA
jgi:hypothetical protein